MDNDKTSHTQWHPLSYVAIELTMVKQFRQLEYQNDVTLGELPPELDLLIIKKQPDVRIEKSIGHIFRTVNVVEYKGIGGSLAIREYIKAVGYACFYCALNDTDPLDMTLTFLRYERPDKLLDELSNRYACEIATYESGIYHVTGKVIFPTQILVIPELALAEYPWLHTLTDKPPGKDILNCIFDDIRNNEEPELTEKRLRMMEDLNRRFPEEMKMIKEDSDMSSLLEEFVDESTLAKINNLQQEVKDIEAQLKDRDAQLKDIETQLQDREAHIAQLQARIRELTAQIG